MSTIQRLLQFSALALLAGPAVAEKPKPVFGDWWYVMPEGWRSHAALRGDEKCDAAKQLEYIDVATYVPVNQPSAGHGGPGYEPGSWMADYAVCVADHLDAIGAPVALLIRDRNCPFPYGFGDVDPLAFEMALEALPKLDYVLMDLERVGPNAEEMIQRNIEEIVRMVRTHPNPRISNAYIGNYNDWPGESDEARIWLNKRNRTEVNARYGTAWDRNDFYKQNLNVAMPLAYPYEIFSRHSDRSIQGDNVTPNDRAAMLWGALERVSVAARNMPEDHLMIPWVSNYVDDPGSEEFYHGPPPPAEDLWALMQHIRMRGAHSFMVWTSDRNETVHGSIDYDTFRTLAMDAWTDLDPLFDSAEHHEFLNLETDKRGGVEWSAVRAGNQIRVLVSNLHHSRAASVKLPAIYGLPARTPVVQPGTHGVFEYTMIPSARDFESDGDLDNSDFIAFIQAVLSNNRDTSKTVGGQGIDPCDIDASGTVDLRDVIAVASAIRDGKYDPPPAPRARSFRGNRRTTGKSTSVATVPTE